MNETIRFWETVKKKSVPIWGITTVLTFVVVKLIDFVLNWAFNKDVAPNGPTYNYTISIFSPVFFVLFIVFITNLLIFLTTTKTTEKICLREKR